MSAIRDPGQINENTTLIDVGMYDAYGVTAVYLIRGTRTCLIDAGTQRSAPRLVKMLRTLDAFPPDLVITTHPHSDHTQGVPLLRQEAARLGKRMDVLAAYDAIPLLADATFNDVFEAGPCESIEDVAPLREGDAIDLGGITLRVYTVPGHCQGHIAILDEKNRTVFVGDAIGYKTSDTVFLPPFMPPTWDPDAFLSSVNQLRQIPYDRLCLAHFGCIYGTEARSILDEAVETCSTWWQFYERHADRLNDPDYLLQAMRKEIDPGTPVLRPVSFRLRVLLGLTMAVTTVTGTKAAVIDRLAFRDTVKDLAIGYRMYTGSG